MLSKVQRPLEPEQGDVVQQGLEHELRVDVDLGHGAVVLVGGGRGLAKHARLDLSAGGNQ